MQIARACVCVCVCVCVCGLCASLRHSRRSEDAQLATESMDGGTGLGAERWRVQAQHIASARQGCTVREYAYERTVRTYVRERTFFYVFERFYYITGRNFRSCAWIGTVRLALESL
jgi:hypothetical protein